VNGGNVPIVGPCQVVFGTTGGDGQLGSGESPWFWNEATLTDIV